MTNDHIGRRPMAMDIPDNQRQPLLTEADTAEILRLKVATLRRWRWAGCGPNFIKCCGAVRYDPADVEAFIDSQRRKSTSDTGQVA